MKEEITQEVREVCVLIPYFNNLEGLIKSIQSVNYDKDKSFIVIVDDGSRERLTSEILETAQVTAIPFQVLTLTRNSGIITALNTGLKWISRNLSVAFIARLDCGDICHPNRFHKQINYLHDHPDTALLGSWCIFKTSNTDQQYKYITPTSHLKIKREMYFRNVFIHPTVIFRTSCLTKMGLYADEYKLVEDYALFWTFLNSSETAVIPDFLVTCEINPTGISISQRKNQILARKRIVREFGTNLALKSLGIFKLNLLLVIPYSFILKIKYLISS
ncbi:glycosyltransferase [Pontibacter sp. 13R65]|uniref:glycosyltransferase n=1 Tax=Pontibacter sp. 13R65 TaxID=3127458 RepID=UPI00301B9E9D